jgi:hypothetical protein
MTDIGGHFFGVQFHSPDVQLVDLITFTAPEPQDRRVCPLLL